MVITGLGIHDIAHRSDSAGLRIGEPDLALVHTLMRFFGSVLPERREPFTGLAKLPHCDALDFVPHVIALVVLTTQKRPKRVLATL